MASSGFKVAVLCPTGHRVTVKVSRETPILEILNEACRKRGLDPSRHRLKHHKSFLDNGLSVRFANLPNNATLDLEELDEASLTVASPKPVKLALQIGDGSRVLVESEETSSLYSVILKAQKAEPPTKGEAEEPVVVYMRREFVGESQLKATTLRQLGITAGTSAAIRFFHKNPELLKDQAKVFDGIQAARPAPIKEETPWRAMKKDCDMTLSQLVPAVPEKSSENLLEAAVDVKPTEIPPEREAVQQRKQKCEREKSELSEYEQQEPEALKVVEPEVLKYVGSSMAVVFRIGGSSGLPRLSQLSDDFFELNIHDVKLMHKDNVRKAKEAEEGGQLLTREIRETREEGQKLCLINRYKKCLVRVQFDFDRLVVQGVFLPGQTVQAVKDFVKEFLVDPEEPFYLFVTPPKKVMDPGLTLLDGNCVPAVLMHFYPEDEGLKRKGRKRLKPELLDQLSNSTGVGKSVLESGVQRKVGAGASAPSTNGNEMEVISSPGPSGIKRPPSDEKRHGAPEDKKVPKWFRGGKR